MSLYLHPYRSSSNKNRMGSVPTNVLITDYMMGRYGSVAGFWHGSHDGANTLFTDGSARWVIDSRLYETLDAVKDNNSGGISWDAVVDCWEFLDEAS